MTRRKLRAFGTERRIAKKTRLVSDYAWML